MEEYAINMKDGDPGNCCVENLEWVRNDTNVFRKNELETESDESDENR